MFKAALIVLSVIALGCIATIIYCDCTDVPDSMPDGKDLPVIEKLPISKSKIEKHV